MGTALAELRSANLTLQQSIAELVMTVHEDRPHGSDVAAVDSLVEIVSEVQASAAEAGAELRIVRDVRGLPDTLPLVHAATSQCALRYWRDLRSYDAVYRLRAAARGRGMEWRTWQHSVEESELRCEQPLQRSAESLHAAWQEIGELLALYLPGTTEYRTAQSATDHPAQASASAISTSARRTS